MTESTRPPPVEQDPTIGRDVMRASRMRELAASQQIDFIAQQLHAFRRTMLRLEPELWSAMSLDEQELYRVAALRSAAYEVQSWGDLAVERGVQAAVKFDKENGDRLATNGVGRAAYLQLVILHYRMSVDETLADTQELRKLLDV